MVIPRTLAAVALLSAPALARPPAGPVDPMIATWFKSLQRDVDHFPCCSAADCRKVEDVTEVGGKYRVKVKREDFTTDDSDQTKWAEKFGDQPFVWMEIEPSRLTIRGDNPTGSSVLCYSVWSADVYCFVPFITGG